MDGLQVRLSAVWRALIEAGTEEEVISFGLLLSGLNDGRGERWGLFDLLYEMNSAVAKTAEAKGDYAIAGRFWHDQGQMLHRKGLTLEAIEVFKRSAANYGNFNEEFHKTESIFMLAVCFRALGEISKAKAILNDVLKTVDRNPWRANPLTVLAWIERDDGNLPEARTLLTEAISLLKQEATHSNSLILAQTLTDLGELNTRLRRYDEAERNFEESITGFKKLQPVDTRQLARSYAKLSKLMRKRRNLKLCDKYLREAVAILEITQHHELAAKVQLELAAVCLYRLQMIKSMRHLLWAWSYLSSLGLERRQLLRANINRFLNKIHIPRLYKMVPPA
jgi:tetratricopeptide (TPR) repeat protein